jgi:hypothetical protein
MIFPRLKVLSDTEQPELQPEEHIIRNDSEINCIRESSARYGHDEPSPREEVWMA